MKSILFENIHLKSFNYFKKPPIDQSEAYNNLKQSERKQKLEIIEYFYNLGKMKGKDLAFYEHLDSDIKLVIDSLRIKGEKFKE